MRPWLVILIGLAALATFDHVVNDGDGIESAVDWLARAGRDVASTIHQFVMTVFGE